MIAARRREREYFANTSEYKHLTQRMGSEHLGKVLSKVCIVLLFFSFRVKIFLPQNTPFLASFWLRNIPNEL